MPYDKNIPIPPNAVLAAGWRERRAPTAHAILAALPVGGSVLLSMQHGMRSPVMGGSGPVLRAVGALHSKGYEFVQAPEGGLMRFWRTK